MEIYTHSYSINVSTEAGTEEYAKIEQTCKDLGYDLMRVYPMKGDINVPEKATLDPAFIFDNQYNTTENHRIHDWYEKIVPNKNMRVGYYMTAEDQDAFNELKVSHYKCGFCGYRHQGHDAPIHCSECLGSTFLAENELHLTVMNPVGGPKRETTTSAKEFRLSQEETKVKYDQAQAKRREKKAAKILKAAKVDAENNSKEILYKAEIHALVLRAGFDIDNLIYYGHKDKPWCWGWQKPLSKEDAAAIRAYDFPFEYSIKEVA